MKIGTVRWFNLQKGYGFIHPDDGSPNICVHMGDVARAGMSDLKEGQRVIFEIQRDERTGAASAVSLTPLVLDSFRHDQKSSNLAQAMKEPTFDGRFTKAHRFDFISALITSTFRSRLRP
jgi:cold shock protein